MSVDTAVVIGAGTSGIVAAKYLVHNGGVKHVVVFEKEAKVGGVFEYGVWAGADMVSSKYVTAFSDYTIEGWWAETNGDKNSTCPMHLSAVDYTRYLEAYAAKFDVLRRIEFRTKVIDVRELPDGDFEVTIERDGESTKTMTVDAVVVGSGLHHTPKVPSMWKEHMDSKTCFHSQDFKSKAQIPPGSRVLILGGGETAHDIAAQAVEAHADTDVCMSLGKDGYIAVPKEMFGSRAPLDVYINNAFEHFAVHEWVWKRFVRWRAMTPIIRVAFSLVSGTSIGLNQWAGRKARVERGWHFIMKTGKSLPYLKRPVVEKQLLKGYPWRWLFPVGNKSIVTKPTASRVVREEGGAYAVTFEDGSTQHFDVVVLCTGYDPSFPFLKGTRDKYYPPTLRNITSPERHSSRLGFVGFVRPNVGAIPPIAEVQAMWFVWFACLAPDRAETLRGRHEDAARFEHLTEARYRLRSTAVGPTHYGCDYGSYMFQVGEDMGACPSIRQLFADREWRLLVVHVFGQAFTQLFRVHGPFADEGTTSICRTLYQSTILTRGVVSNTIFAIAFLIFGAINVVCFALEALLNLVFSPRRSTERSRYYRW